MAQDIMTLRQGSSALCSLPIELVEYIECFMTKITTVHASSDRTMIITNNSVLESGKNCFGQLSPDGKKYRDTFNALPALPDGKRVKRGYSGFSHTTILAEDGTVFCRGCNIYGQLGLGDTNDRNTFTAVPALPDGKVVKKVISRYTATMILAEDSTVFASGNNGNGQLGLGDKIDRNVFTAVPALLEGKLAKQVVTGDSYTMILANDGTVFGCGENKDGQLGLGDNMDRNTFVPVPALPDGKLAKQVVAGSHHTMILAEDGTVFACGHNTSGHLGLGDTNQRNTFTQVPALPDGKVAKQVIAGQGHTMILADDGTVFACGGNCSGQLGLGDTNSRKTFTAVPALPYGVVAKQVIAGSFYTMILTHQFYDRVFVCGSNRYGQLGLNHTNKMITFTEVSL